MLFFACKRQQLVFLHGLPSLPSVRALPAVYLLAPVAYGVSIHHQGGWSTADIEPHRCGFIPGFVCWLIYVQATCLFVSTDITIDKKLETVRSFKYLGAIVSDGGSKPEVLPRIAKTIAAVAKLNVIWNDKNIAISSKSRLMRSLAMRKFLYTCETWTITADIERRIQALEMRCFRKLLGISYRDHITNEEVKARIGNALEPYEDFSEKDAN